ncbi:MAG: serine hydrolase [Bacteroidales bacterium]|nr:serine hydrolase [Bacteroidales bacterium]
MNILSGYDLLSSFIMSNLINKNGRFLIHKTAISGVLLFYLCFSGFSQTTKTSTVEASVALAYPVTNITIDGNDTDWPVKSVKYRIGNIFWKKPDTNADISGYFMTGYNPVEQALYFAVVVSDDSHIIDTSANAGSNNQDSYSLYLDSKNLPSGSGVVSYQFNEIWKRISNPADSWDPDVINASWDNVSISCKHSGSESIYEYRIVLNDQVRAGRSFGIDHIITDKDSADNSKSYTQISWCDQEEKENTPGKLGYLILMKSGETAGNVSGSIQWANPAISGFPSRIRITSVSNPGLWVLTPVDSTGKYSVDLPQGSYEISPLSSFNINESDYFRIDRNNSKVVVKASANTVVKAPILKLYTVAPPDLLPEKGILFDFDESKSFIIDDFIKQYQEYYEIPGVSLAIIKGGQVIYHKTYGVKNTFTKEPIDGSTLFEAASITKTVFAFAVNSLAEKGIIDLNKPLYQYLPFEEIAYDERYKLMTARHVLSHQTGLPNWAYMNADGKLDLKFTPGTGYGYSGEGFEYLKRVVEKITGKPVGIVLEEEVIKPLGLTNMYFEKCNYLAKVVANGHYENFPTRAELPESPGMAWSLHTEALAFSSYVLALMNRKGLKPETYDEMFRIQSVVPLDEEEKNKGLEIYYGLGIKLEKTPFGFVFEHGGNNGDFQCQFKMFTDLNMGFIVFTNSNTGGKLKNDALTQFLITGRGNTK